MFKRTNTESHSNHSYKENVESSFINISKSLKQMISLLKIYDTNDLNNIRSTLQELNRNNISIQKKITRCLNLIPSTEDYQYVECLPSMQIKRVGNIYKYELDDLIPHIIRVDTDNNKLNYLYDTNAIYSGYRRAVEEYSTKIPFETFSKKIIICFINFYKKEEDGVDVDNLDTKPFIDAAVSRILVPDDNPKWVNIFLLTAEGTEHTEVIAGYPKDVISYLSNNNLSYNLL